MRKQLALVIPVFCGLILPALILSALIPIDTAYSRERLKIRQEHTGRINFQTAVNLRDPNSRHQYVQALAEKSTRQRNAALQKAHKHGWKVRGRTNGTVFELVSIDRNRPTYRITCNANSAISSGANLLHIAPSPLLGTGIIVGLWDAGAVRYSHDEFDNIFERVMVMDGADADSNHATHVAGTIGARGSDAAAKGMAPEVYIDSYDWRSDISEMFSRAMDESQAEGDIQLSNHSYINITGWQIGDFNNTGSDAPYWFGLWGEREDRDFGRYSLETMLWDALSYQAQYYLPFKAAGNDRDDNDNAPAPGVNFWYFDSNSGNWLPKDYNSATDPCDDGWDNGGFDTITTVGCAKNIMTIGAVNDAVLGGLRDANEADMTDFSNWGPTDDGRIKPDIVANGYDLYSAIATGDSNYGIYSGTSMASPSAAGSAALLVESYNDAFGKSMRADTLKGLLIHTATDLGNTGPDYKFGWGLIDVNQANNYIEDDATIINEKKIIEGVLTPGTSNTYKIASDGNSIKATLCWIDPPGSYVAGPNSLDSNSPRLINDLDMRIIDYNEPIAPNSVYDTVYSPWVLDPNNPDSNATFGDNYLDNVEQVYIASPNTGIHGVKITYEGTLKNSVQRYCLILSEPIETTYIYVDDDAAGDPGPGDPTISDPCEDGSFANPYDAVQKAVDDVNDGATIIVLDGTYTGVGNYNIDPCGLAITIKSENGPDDCTIDCEQNGRAFILQSGESSTTIIDGFTIINGYAEDPNWYRYDEPSGYGGAIYCYASSPVIQNCHLTDNTADTGGGAIYCNAGGNALIDDCKIKYNYCGNGFYAYPDVNLNDFNDINLPGGGIYCRDSSPVIINSTISFNQAAGSGGGIACEDGDPFIGDCYIYENDSWVDDDYIAQHGGGIFCKNSSAVIFHSSIAWNDAKWSGGGIAAVWDSNDMNDLLMVISCAILDNDCWASAGGVYSEGGVNHDISDPCIIYPNVYMQNCIIANNWGYWSGGLSTNEDSYMQIQNCTMANNVASYSYTTSLIGGLESYYGNAFVRDSIFWGNTGVQIATEDDVTVHYSNVQRLDPNGNPDPNNRYPGEGNINLDPLFASPIRRDYHLKTAYPDGRYNMQTESFDSNDTETSPSINSGDPNSDYSAEPYPHGDRINMGTYGNLWQASMSDESGSTPGNIIGSNFVNMLDYAVLADNWLLEGSSIKDRRADLNSDGTVDEMDMFIMAKFWLWQPGSAERYIGW